MKRKMTLVHPGEILKMEIIEGRELTIGGAAELLGITRVNLSRILSGKAAITPNMALRIEKVFGGSAKFWIRLQSSYDFDIAEKQFSANPPDIRHFQSA